VERILIVRQRTLAVAINVHPAAIEPAMGGDSALNLRRRVATCLRQYRSDPHDSKALPDKAVAACKVQPHMLDRRAVRCAQPVREIVGMLGDYSQIVPPAAPGRHHCRILRPHALAVDARDRHGLHTVAQARRPEGQRSGILRTANQYHGDIVGKLHQHVSMRAQ